MTTPTSREARTDAVMLQSMAASFRARMDFSFNPDDMADLMERCAEVVKPGPRALPPAHEAAPEMKLKQAAQVLHDLLHMKGRHHEGMTHADIEALWNAAKDGTGYAAVSAFLSALMHQTEVTSTLAALEGDEA